MDIGKRVEALEAKHADLEAKIEAEDRHPAPDEAKLKGWKIRKLGIRDELDRLGAGEGHGKA